MEPMPVPCVSARDCCTCLDIALRGLSADLPTTLDHVPHPVATGVAAAGIALRRVHAVDIPARSTRAVRGRLISVHERLAHLHASLDRAGWTPDTADYIDPHHALDGLAAYTALCRRLICEAHPAARHWHRIAAAERPLILIACALVLITLIIIIPWGWPAVVRHLGHWYLAIFAAAVVALHALPKAFDAVRTLCEKWSNDTGSTT